MENWKLGVGFYHFQFSIFNFQLIKYVKLQCEGLGVCEEGLTRGDKDVNMVPENHVAGIFVRDLVVVLYYFALYFFVCFPVVYLDRFAGRRGIGVRNQYIYEHIYRDCLAFHARFLRAGKFNHGDHVSDFP